MQHPKKHHYLPVFYLKRWAGDDGRLCQFSRPHAGVVVPNRKYPSETGFLDRLYEMRGVPPDQAQKIEAKFLQPVDTAAAEALSMLENGDPLFRRDPKARSAWSRFIMSLMLRKPEDIAALKSGVAASWAQGIAGAFAERYGPTALQEYLSGLGADQADNLAMSIAPQLIDHSRIGHMLNNMRWIVRRFTNSDTRLMTSDRPLVMSWTLTEPNAFLFLPIGPQTMFIAVNDVETQHVVENRDPGEQVEAINQFLTARAVKFVYAQDDTPLQFVKDHFATNQRQTLLEQVVERHRKERQQAAP